MGVDMIRVDYDTLKIVHFPSWAWCDLFVDVLSDGRDGNGISDMLWERMCMKRYCYGWTMD
jgi:hypothetical protein